MSTNPAGFLLSYANEVFVRQDWTVALDPIVSGQSIIAGSLADLRDPRTSTRVTVQNSRVGAGTVRVMLRFQAPDVDAGPTIEAGLMGLLNSTITAPGATSVTIEAEGQGPAITPPAASPKSVWTPPTADFPRHLWVVYSLSQAGMTTVRVWITATFGSSGGTLTLTTGGLWVGPALVPADGIDAEWRMEVVDPGTMARSAGGQGFARQRQRYRQLSGSVRNIGVEWAYGVSGGTNIDVQQLLYRVGTTTPVVVFARTRNAAGDLDVHTQHRLGIYGHFSDLGSIAHEGGNVFSWTGFRVAELL